MIELMEKLHMHVTLGRTIFAIADEPELVREVADMWPKVQHILYQDSPGGRNKWELRGFDLDLFDDARRIALEQSEARRVVA